MTLLVTYYYLILKVILILTPDIAFSAPKFMKLQKRNPQLNSEPASAALGINSISLSSGLEFLEKFFIKNEYFN